MEINFSRGDLLAGQPIAPGWYKGTIKSDKVVIEGGRIDNVIVLDFENAALAADERTVQHTFFHAVEKGKGFLVPYMAALLNKPVKEILDGLEKGTLYGFSIGEDKNTGAKIQFKLINEPYQGRILNKIETFIPYGMEAPV